MSKLTPQELRQVDATIKAVAQAQSSRFFKADHNTTARSDFVFLAIGAEVAVALHDAGHSMRRIFGEIDPTSLILEQMLADGYIIGESLVPMND
jgi:hypothetical protein